MQKTDISVLSSEGAKLSLKSKGLTVLNISDGSNIELAPVLNEKQAGAGGRAYTLNYSVKDNGEYDANNNLGKITDPVVPGITSSGSDTGCVLNPHADVSYELVALVMVALLGICLRMRRRHTK
ncbi:hypothetical protein [Maridesulfovibrio sp.]|uniref:hypothetical protein n=1 Tax=Maridesulfovibrio sp. TaxID=2795000 RepID=UPI0029F501B1|nr:hypothetical protein [Maridesulfovibrio sp.]